MATPPALFTESPQTSAPSSTDTLLYSAFQGPPTLTESFLIFLLFPLAFQVCIMVAHNKLVRHKLQMRDELSLNTSSVCLGKKWRQKSCFRNIWGVLNVDFVSFLTCFYEGGKKLEKISFRFRQEACSPQGQCHGRKVLSPTVTVPTMGVWASFSPTSQLRLFVVPISRVFPDSLGPVPKFPHLGNGDISSFHFKSSIKTNKIEKIS